MRAAVIRAAAVVMLGLGMSAWAGTPVDNTNDMIECDTVIAVASSKPAFVIGGIASTLVKVKGTVVGIDVNAGLAVSGSFSGTLTRTSNDCLFLAGTSPLTGSLVFKWKSLDPTHSLTQPTSTVNVTTITGGSFAPGGSFGPAFYLTFTLGISGVTGGFTGGDGGTTSSNTLVMSQDVGAFLNGCQGAGFKTFNLGLGTITLQ